MRDVQELLPSSAPVPFLQKIFLCIFIVFYTHTSFVPLFLGQCRGGAAACTPYWAAELGSEGWGFIKTKVP